MPVRLEKKWESGWKRNNPDDPILSIYFIDEKSNKLLFVYAPKHSDRIFFDDAFNELTKHEINKWKACKKI